MNTNKIDALAVMKEVQSILPRMTIADGNLAEDHFNAIAAVAALIAERDRLANIVNSHEKQILRMASERAELIEAARAAREVDKGMSPPRSDWDEHRRLDAALARVGAAQ